MKIYNETLNSEFFVDDKLRPNIRKTILSIVKDFLTENVNLDLPEIDDIQLTGSLANFNYTPQSDVDVHILFDFKKINPDKELVKTALDGIRFNWNTKHNITLHGHDVELYFQDSNEPHISTGLYSILKDNWVKKPKHQPPALNDEDINKKVNDIKFFIDTLEELIYRYKKDKNKSEIYHKYSRRLFSKIKKMRQEGLQDAGEFSVGNLTFKFLRASKYIDKLSKIVNLSYDNIYTESMFRPNKVNHRHMHSVVRDPAGRKHARTIPAYVKNDTDLPRSFKIIQQPAGPKFIYINPQDAYKICVQFGIRDLKRPKGCKKSGVSIGQKPNGKYYLMRTKKNKNNYMR